MKLVQQQINIEKSDDMKEYSYSIGDEAIIFDILRNKLYSNPIFAVCREIPCNALDAHKEVGKSDIPIEIKLPNSFDPNLKIKDYGPGISPERIENIYVKYGVSTKRDSDNFIGGFGLGSRTPMSVSDSFAIQTIYNNIKYNYLCYIDESRVGKVSLLSTEETFDQNGTEIIIPVKSNDFNAFKEGIEFATRHWVVKPIITGSKIDYKTPTKNIVGNNWFISSNNNNYDYNYSGSVKLLNDNIEYPLDLNQIKLDFNIKQFLQSLVGTLYLQFKIGDLSLAANRESVHLDDKTSKIITNTLLQVISEVDAAFRKSINDFPTFLDACIYLAEAKSAISNPSNYFKDLTWNNKKLYINNMRLNNGRSLKIYKSNYYTRANKYERLWTTSIGISKKTKLLFNDTHLKEITAKHVSDFLNKYENVQIIHPGVNDKQETYSYDEMISSNEFLEDLGIEKLSNYIKVKQPKQKTPNSKPKFIINKFYNNKFMQIAYSNYKDNTNKKIFTYLTKQGNKNCVIINNKIINFDLVKTLLQKLPGYDLFGVDEDVPEKRIKEGLGDIISIEDAVKMVVKDFDLDEMAALYHQRYILNQDNIIKNVIKYKDCLLDTKSEFLTLAEKYVSLANKLEENKELYILYSNFFGYKDDASSIIKDKDIDIDAIIKNIYKKYPMIEVFYYIENSYEYKLLINHINIIDRG